MGLLLCAVLMFATTVAQSCAFIVPPHQQRTNHPRQRHSTHHTHILFAADHDDDIVRRNIEARTDVRNLLTQRAIQSFMYLCETCRDPHSVKWIEDFLGTKGQLNYHGTGAGYIQRCGGVWDGPLAAMLQHPKDVVIVSAKRRGRGHGGWSKNNPYLEERWVEFEIDIDPVSLAARILTVREQIAAEWVKDLDVVATANDLILDSYFARAKAEREKKGEDDDDDDVPTSTNTIAFERTAVNLLNNHTAFTEGSSSPFRKGNFDLLYNLCTQASVHRLLKQLAGAGSAKEVSYEWLLSFYNETASDYFDGDLPYGRADDFIEKLLLTSPKLVVSADGKAGLADPLGLAEQIIDIRKDLVVEWKELMKRVPEDHTNGIRKVLLEKQMEAWSSSSGPVAEDGGEAFQ